MTRLQRLPVDIVKLDRSFIQHLPDSTQDRSIVTSVIDLSHSLGATVVGEAIEIGEQRGVLRDLGCGVGQGFHLARPTEGSDITAMLRAGR